MNNWLTTLEGASKEEKELYSILENLKIQIPSEEKTINNIISSLGKEPLSDDFLFEIRDTLRKIISKDEHNIIRKKEHISKAIKSISSLRTTKNKDGLYNFEDCFYDFFDFKMGKNFYYLKFPSLHEKVDGNTNIELMMDRYIKDFIKSSLSDYQLGRKNFEQFSEFTLILIHHLLPENAKNIDTDNLEIKKPIDGINKILVKNDTANYSDIYQIVRQSDFEYTEMFVIKGHALSTSILKLLEGLNSDFSL